MRTAILVAAVVSLSTAACHRPSYGSGARSLASSVKKMGKQVAAIAGKVDVKVGVAVDRDKLAAVAKDKALQQVTTRVAAIEPITISKSVHKSSSGGSAPVQQPVQDIEPTVIRHDASGGGASEQVWKNLYRAGEKATCEKVETFEACSATCSEHMRGQSMRQLDPDAGKPEQCECTQGYSKC